MTTQSNRLSEHKVYRLRQLLRQYGIWALFLGIVTYDPADDGPEADICRFFYLFPEGSSNEDWRGVYLEAE